MPPTLPTPLILVGISFHWISVSSIVDLHILISFVLAIFRDLDYVASVWSNTCFDLWEEVNALHFFTLMVQRRALLAGAEYGARVSHSNNYTTVATSIASKIDTFWSDSAGIIEYSQSYVSGVGYKSSGLDTAVLLAAIHGGYGDSM
jgi:glucoamylase